jgi:AcrR family transcriptional regulator
MVDVTITGAAPAPADPDRRAPGRPRSARADEAIIEAVLALLADGMSADQLSIEAVAARAGVGKATIYRRWSNKEALLVDAVAALKGPLPELAGVSVRDDLLTLMRPMGRTEAKHGRVTPGLLSQLNQSERLQQCWQRVTEPRRALMRQVLRRGIERGELRADLDVDVAMAMISAPVILQTMINWNPALDRETLPERLLTMLWPAIAAR